MDIRLFIKNDIADIGDKAAFARNFKQTKQFSDLENPMNITTDFSYSISLPGTDNNRRIFGWIDESTDPQHFNPNALTPYHVNINGNLVSQGNLQLTEIKNNNGNIEFVCSFYSKVHEIMMDLANKPLKDLTGLKYNNSYKHYLDKNLLGDFWNGMDQMCDMIRYVPCRAGMYPNFQNSKTMSPDGNGWGAGDIGVDCDEYATREYRVQYQRPALSMELLTDYIMDDMNVTIDSSVLNSPYIQDSWLVCPQMSQEDREENCYGTTSTINNSSVSYEPTSDPESFTSCYFNMYDIEQTSTLSTGDTIFDNLYVTPEENGFNVSIEFCIKVDCSANYDFTHPGNYGVYNNPSTIYFPAWDPTWGQLPKCKLRLRENGNTSHVIVSKEESASTLYNNWILFGGNDGTKYFFSRTDAHQYSEANYSMYRNGWGSSISGWGTGSDGRSNLFPMHFTFSLTNTDANYDWRPYFQITTLNKVLWQSCNDPGGNTYARFRTSKYRIQLVPMESLTTEQISILQDNGFVGKTFSYNSKTTGHSPLYVDTGMILGSDELNCKDFLTDLTKMLGCVWEFDTSTGGVKIVTRNNYFQNSSVLDWTHKLDRSSMSIKPLSFNKHTYTMSYKDGKSMLEENFKAKIGKDYGKQYIDTGYPFNDEKESLFESKFLNTVQCKGERKCVWRNSSDVFKVHTQTSYEIPMIEKKNHGAPDEGYRILFNSGWIDMVDDEKVYVTQDSSYMYTDAVGGKCWIDIKYANQGYSVLQNCIRAMDKIPLFSTKKGYASWDFAKPEISFSSESDSTYDPNICLYPRFWSKYIRNVYDAKTRVMTAKFHLDTDDLINFSFKNFVRIDNHLWHPNKLIDYNMSGEDLTQVELIEVNDTDAWINGQNWDFKNAPIRNGYDGEHPDENEENNEENNEEEIE